jgi:transposase-like protein
MECPHCHSANLKKDGLSNGRQMYTCRDCFHKHTNGAKNHLLRPVEKQARKVRRPAHPCLHCGKETTRPRFCSQSCVSTYSNLHDRERYAKRQINRIIRYCKYCGVQLDGRRTTCIVCNHNIVEWDEVKLSEIEGKAKYQIHAQVRRIARSNYRISDCPKFCINCGYSKHYEVCHIRPITDFPLDTTIGAINDLSNLVALCPNCHWEFDHHMLSLEEIRAKNNASF